MADTVEEEFFEYLAGVNTKDVKLYAVDEGKVVFPRSVLNYNERSISRLHWVELVALQFCQVMTPY